MQPQKTVNCQINLEKKNKAEGIMHPNFTIYYNARVIKQHSTGTKQTQVSMEQKGKLRNKPRHYGQLIYNKGVKNIQCK